VFGWYPEYTHWRSANRNIKTYHVPCVYEVCKSLKVFELLLVAHLFIEDNELSLDFPPFGQFPCESFLNLTHFPLLKYVRILLQLLRHLLLHQPLLLDLIS
jgi:hypothetical protein